MSGACATCGGADHRRSSSSRCPQRKKRVRESAEYNGLLETYTVKQGLCGFVCPLLEDNIKEKLFYQIRRDVKDLSAFSIDFSILAHYFYLSRMLQIDNDSEFLRLHPQFDGRALAAVLCGDSSSKVKQVARLCDSNGLLDIWSTFCQRRYDVKLRSFAINHIVNGYATVLETNVRTHAFARIKRGIASKTNLDRKTIHDACYKRYYSSELTSDCPEVDEWFNTQVPEPPTAKLLEHNYWRFIPMFRRLQAEAWTSATKLSDAKGRGFRLFPQYCHGLKHLIYDSCALFELLRRVDKDSTPSTWVQFNKSDEESGKAGSRLYWRRYFTCPANFGYSIRMDGVAVSLTVLKRTKNMVNVTENKPAKKKRKIVKFAKHNIRTIETPLPLPVRGYVAVDPGAREPIVTCSEDDAGKMVFTKLTAGRVYFETGELWRQKKRKKITTTVDEKVREDEKRSESIEDYSSKHGGNPYAYTKFRHKHFDNLQCVYEKRKLARLKFDKYSRRQKFMARVVKEFFPDPEKTILYGAGYKFMNRATFRGHRKFSHNSLLRELKRSGRSVLPVDETYTTKRCYRCFGHSMVKVSPSPHRYVHCPVCRRGTNRDRNGAANILLKSTGRWNNINSQPLFPTTVRMSCKSGTDSPP